MMAESNMKIAVAYNDGKVSAFFERATEFVIFTVENDKITHEERIVASDMLPDGLIGLLVFNDTDVVICGGIKEKSLKTFLDVGIRVYPGIGGDARNAALKLIDDTLEFSLGMSCSHNHSHDK